MQAVDPIQTLDVPELDRLLDLLAAIVARLLQHPQPDTPTPEES